MRPTAIVYTSNTGYTAEYARLLSINTGLPYYSIESASKSIPKNTVIIYLGWLMAGCVKGYKTANKKYAVSAVCGVGMGTAGSQTQDVRKVNAIPEKIPVFTLQGGFNSDKLHGIYKFMMKVMKKTLGKGLEDKNKRTPDEDAMLDMLKNGGNYVSEKNLTEVLNWYSEEDGLL